MDPTATTAVSVGSKPWPTGPEMSVALDDWATQEDNYSRPRKWALTACALILYPITRLLGWLDSRRPLVRIDINGLVAVLEDAASDQTLIDDFDSALTDITSDEYSRVEFGKARLDEIRDLLPRDAVVAVDLAACCAASALLRLSGQAQDMLLARTAVERLQDLTASDTSETAAAHIVIASSLFGLAYRTADSALAHEVERHYGAARRLSPRGWQRETARDGVKAAKALAQLLEGVEEIGRSDRQLFRRLKAKMLRPLAWLYLLLPSGLTHDLPLLELLIRQRVGSAAARRLLVSRLAIRHRERFEASGLSGDLHVAVALGALGTRECEDASVLAEHAVDLRMFAMHVGDRSVMAEALSLGRLAVALARTGSSESRRSRWHYANTAKRMYMSGQGDLELLDESVAVFRKFVEEDGGVTAKVNLSSGLLLRGLATGALSDLKEAVDLLCDGDGRPLATVRDNALSLGTLAQAQMVYGDKTENAGILHEAWRNSLLVTDMPVRRGDSVLLLVNVATSAQYTEPDQELLLKTLERLAEVGGIHIHEAELSGVKMGEGALAVEAFRLNGEISFGEQACLAFRQAAELATSPEDQALAQSASEAAVRLLQMVRIDRAHQAAIAASVADPPRSIVASAHSYDETAHFSFTPHGPTTDLDVAVKRLRRLILKSRGFGDVAHVIRVLSRVQLRIGRSVPRWQTAMLGLAVRRGSLPRVQLDLTLDAYAEALERRYEVRGDYGAATVAFTHRVDLFHSRSVLPPLWILNLANLSRYALLFGTEHIDTEAWESAVALADGALSLAELADPASREIFDAASEARTVKAGALQNLYLFLQKPHYLEECIEVARDGDSKLELIYATSLIMRHEYSGDNFSLIEGIRRLEAILEKLDDANFGAPSAVIKAEAANSYRLLWEDSADEGALLRADELSQQAVDDATPVEMSMVAGIRIQVVTHMWEKYGAIEFAEEAQHWFLGDQVWANPIYHGNALKSYINFLISVAAEMPPSILRAHYESIKSSVDEAADTLANSPQGFQFLIRWAKLQVLVSDRLLVRSIGDEAVILLDQLVSRSIGRSRAEALRERSHASLLQDDLPAALVLAEEALWAIRVACAEIVALADRQALAESYASWATEMAARAFHADEWLSGLALVAFARGLQLNAPGLDAVALRELALVDPAEAARVASESARSLDVDGPGVQQRFRAHETVLSVAAASGGPQERDPERFAVRAGLLGVSGVPPLLILVCTSHGFEAVLINTGQTTTFRNLMGVDEMQGLVGEFEKNLTHLESAVSVNDYEYFAFACQQVLEALWNNCIRDLTRAVIDEIGDVDPWVAVCAVGPLAVIPWHAVGGHSAGVSDSLLHKFAVSYVADLEAYLASTHQNEAFVLQDVATIVADQVEGWENLHHAREEALWIRDNLPRTGFGGETVSASRRGFLNAVAGSSVIHMSCHVDVSDEREPASSVVVLRDAATNPITALDLSRLRNLDAQLAFLAGCYSGLARGRLPDQSMSIAHSFARIGYRNIISSMWSVRDDLALEVTKGFYSRLLGFHEEKIQSKEIAHALRSVLLTEMDRTGARFYEWAPYVHIVA